MYRNLVQYGPLVHKAQNSLLLSCPTLYSLHPQGQLTPLLANPPQPSHLHSSHQEGTGQRRKDKSGMLTII